MLVALIFTVLGAGVAVALLISEPWDSNGAKDFSMTLGTDDDFRDATRQMEAFLPDFNCAGGWDERLRSGFLGCEAGLAGFGCEFKYPHPAVVCKQGEQLPEGFPVCTVEGSERVRCSGPKTDAFCRVRFVGSFVVTCQRA